MERIQEYLPYGFPGHEGIDIGLATGSEIYAVADGVVSQIKLDGNTSPYGNHLRVQHEGGNYETIYAHLSQVTVALGQAVQAGQVIALSGNSGSHTTGPHLHLTLKKRGAQQAGETNYPSDVVDPTPYMEQFTGGGVQQPTPPAQSSFNVQVFNAGDGLNMRQSPYVGSPVVTKLPNETILGVLEEDACRRKVGQLNQWLWVRAPGGQVGHVAAGYVCMPGAAPPPAPARGDVSVSEAHHVQIASQEGDVNVRQGPDTGQQALWQVPNGAVLESLEDPQATIAKVGQVGQWLRARSQARKEGHVEAWHLRLPSQTDDRQPAVAGELPKGVSPYIFGIHAAELPDDPHTKDAIRGLYRDKGKAGWVFFTQRMLTLAEQAVLFYAQSGAGKTSLLNARVIPILEKKGVQVLPVARVGSSLPASIDPGAVENIFVFSALMGLAADKDIPPEALLGHSLRSYLQMTYAWPSGGASVGRLSIAAEQEAGMETCPTPHQPTLLILDQFEEIATTHREHWEQAESFFRQVREAIDRLPGLGVLFVLREDYVAELDPYTPLLPSHLQARFRMTLPTRPQAMQIVMGPASKPAAALPRKRPTTWWPTSAASRGNR
ncbi:MAG: M23 family metallopeptidase [Thermoflexales bacterium]|nr:M23 family metallopeptidase [Thermoflexales bacterium]